MPLEIVKRHNSRNWYLRGTVRGIPVDESTKTDNREAAEQIRIKREADLLHRSIHGERATVTFLQAAVEYMERGGETRFMPPLLKRFGTRLLSSLTQSDIDKAARDIYPRNKPSSWDRSVYAPMSAVLKLGARNKWCDYIEVEKPTYNNARIRWIYPAQAAHLVSHCAPHMAPLVTFLFGTGARLSEALYLQWTDVDLKAGTAKFTDTKNGEERLVPMSPKAHAALQALYGEGKIGPVFLTNKGLPYKPAKDCGGQIKTAFNAAVRRAKMADFTPHDCRHTWATWHYHTHKSIPDLMRLGGWKSSEIVMRYAHSDVSKLADGVKKIGW